MKHPGKNGEDLYDTSHGGRVLSMAPGLNGMTILKFKQAAYDITQQKMAFFDKERKQDFKPISGTDMRKYARERDTPPLGFMAPKAWDILAQYYQECHEETSTNGIGQ